jgi:hypothetical protein
VYKYIFSKTRQPKETGDAYTYQNDAFEKQEKEKEKRRGQQKKGGKK